MQEWVARWRPPFSWVSLSISISIVVIVVHASSSSQGWRRIPGSEALHFEARLDSKRYLMLPIMYRTIELSIPLTTFQQL
ncbi:hypothetical protein BKA56DRAFT_595045 [Ilyonectria sp. MPI-CAGE-AT-0026]|nr:hypothetical protein BKA56DRAFT_595045 [Ilyonectria sp. MPI-CAGE-AT-0026]